MSTLNSKTYLKYKTNLIYPLEVFLKNILIYDVIDGYVIIRDSTVALQTLNNKTITIEKIKKDSTGTLTVGNKNYKYFDYKFKFDDKEDWDIIALVDNTKYSSITRSINLWIIVNFFLLVIVLVVGMPFLKLVFMNPIERLFRTNVCFSGISFILGIPLIILFIAVLNNYFNLENDKVDKNLSQLSIKVTDNFENELCSSLERLDTFDSDFDRIEEKEGHQKNKLWLYKNTKDSIEIIASTKETKETKETKYHFNNDSLKIIYDFDKDLNELLWMDDNGDVRLRITKNQNKKPVNIEVIPPDSVIVKSRDYYSKIQNKQGYKFYFDQHNNFVSESIFIESIYSYRTGKPEIAVSKSSQLKLITEKTTKTEQTDKTKKTEASKDTTKLEVGAITTRFESVMNPILPLGYSYCIINNKGDVLVHSNNSKNLQENLLEEADDTGQLGSLLFAGHSGHTIIDYNNQKHKVFIKKFGGNTTPFYVVTMCNLEFTKAKVSETWSVTFILFLIGLVLMALIILAYFIMTVQKRKLLVKDFFFDWMTPNKNLYLKYKKLTKANSILSLILVVTFIVIYFTTPMPGYQLAILTIIPSISFVFTHYNLNDTSKKRNKNKFIIGLLFITVVIGLMSALLYPDECLLLLGISAFVIAGIYLSPSNTKDSQESLKHKDNYITSYARFLLSWLVFSSLLPMLLMFISYSSIENEIWYQYTNKKYDNLKELKESNHPELNFSEYGFAEYIKPNRKTSKYRNALANIRPEYNQMIAQNEDLIYEVSEDKIKTFDNNLSLWSWIFIVFISGLLLCLIYKLIIFCLYKIYGLNYETHGNIDLDKTKEAIKNTIRKKKNSIIIGVPGAGKFSFLKNLFKEFETDFEGYQYIDFSKEQFFIKIGNTYKSMDIKYVNQFLSESLLKSVIVLDNFHFDSDDPSKNDFKLKILKKIKLHKVPIVIISELNPSDIIDYHYRAIITESNEDVDKGALKNDVNRKEWRKLMAYFTEFYLPLKDFSNSLNDTKYKNELKKGKYLYHLKDSIVIHERGIKPNNGNNYLLDNEILSIEQQANSYYYGLWNALSRKEKFLVYDLAYDGFINTANVHVINRLINKGVIVFDNKLELMNKSFANFVLTIVNKGEIIEMNKEVRKKGKWGNIRQVIILVVIALVVLIGLGQPHFLQNINAVIISLVSILSGLAGILKIVSISNKV